MNNFQQKNYIFRTFLSYMIMFICIIYCFQGNEFNVYFINEENAETGYRIYKK